jgi:N-acetylneuraminic acid mutarotase
MKLVTRLFASAFVVAISLYLASCSGLPGGAGSPTGPSSSYTIGGTVSGLAAGSTGFVLQDNGGDNLSVSSNGAFTFKTAVPSTSAAYAVTVFSPPTPAQTCTISGGAGTASANVTTVVVTCTVGTASIGGTVTGLTGSGLVLQDNAGDNLTINAPGGAFTFKTAITLGNAYSVTVLTQPITPSQTCIITGGSGTANANVGNIQVTCSVGTISIGGTIAGLSKSGSGIVLQDNGGSNLTINANGSFAFASLLPAGAAYAVTILTQPTGPAQTCTVTNGTGTTSSAGNVVNVQIICPAIFHTIGGQVVGLIGTSGNMVLTDNGGDNLPVPGNGSFTFVTQIADGSVYDVDIFVPAGTQPQGCVRYNYSDTAISDVTNVLIDCGHNDWAWMDGDDTGNEKGSFTAVPNPLPATPSQNSSTPGGRRYPATWTDLAGNLWLFGGYGLSYDPNFPLQPAYFDDMWEYTNTHNYFGGFYDIWQVTNTAGSAGPAGRWGAASWTDPSTGLLYLFGGENDVTFYNDLWSYNPAAPPASGAQTWSLVAFPGTLNGVYGTINVANSSNFPGARWGATVRVDPSGRLWLFGGYGYDSSSNVPGLLNDLWVFQGGVWTWVSGSSTANAPGDYGVLGTAAASNIPGARQSSASWLDASGNFWVFGGFDLNGTGQPDALNDLWEYNVTTKQWTWQSGSNSVNQPAVYGTQGVAAATNVPGAAWSSAAWTDLSGNLWLFGGQGFDSTGDGSLSDIWEYKAGQWIWVKGPGSVSQPGIYGIQDDPIVWPEVTNNPGGRWAPGYWTVDINSGFGPYREFWIFGGEGDDSAGSDGNLLLDDLWRYLPYP